MKREIAFALSAETAKKFEKAVKEVNECLEAGATIVEVRKSDDGHGNPVGIIVVDEEI